jgi:hypothetical protein
MAKKLYIVSVYRPELLDGFLMHFGTSRDAKVVLDRRHGERRAQARRPAGSLQKDRRRRTQIDRELRERGYAVVELTDAPPSE